MALISWEENEKEFTAKQKDKNLDVKPNFRVLMETFNEVAQLTVRHECETVTYGAAIQMKKAIETNGLLCAGNLEDIVQTHQNTFTSTSKPTFLLSQDH